VDLLYIFYRFIVKRLRPLFVGGAIQIAVDWLIDLARQQIHNKAFGCPPAAADAGKFSISQFRISIVSVASAKATTEGYR